MATDLTTIFGTEIKVCAQPRRPQRQYVGFAGGDGVVSMHMGTRGRQIVITGKLSATGTDYDDARSNLQNNIDTIEEYLYSTTDADSYSFKGQVFDDVVFESFNLLPDSQGKAFHFTSEGYVTADFICYLIEQT